MCHSGSQKHPTPWRRVYFWQKLLEAKCEGQEAKHKKNHRAFIISDPMLINALKHSIYDLYSSKELDKTASDSQGDTPYYSPWAKTSWDMSSKIRSLLAWVWSDVGSLENVHSPVGSLHVTADACWPVWFIFSYVTVVPELFWWIQNYYHCRKGHRFVTKWITLTKRVRVGVISTLSHLEETWMSSLMWRTAIKC